MIYTSSPINGTKLTLGYISSNIGMAAGQSYVIYQLYYKEIVSETPNEILLWTIAVMHMLLGLHLFIFLSCNLSERFWRIFKIIEFLLQLFQFTVLAFITMALKEAQFNEANLYLRNLERTWLVMELFTLVAYILSNVVYLSVR